MTNSLRKAARVCVAATLVAFVFASVAQAQPVQQIRGADSRVDYASLKAFGPWDDRNYQLTAEDVALLAPNEAELGGPVPAFFRVEVRKAVTARSEHGLTHYPRSMLPVFRLRYGGYLIEGKLYAKVEQRDGVFEVKMEDGISNKVFEAEGWEGIEKVLTGDVRVTSPVGAAESAIKINHTNVDQVIAGSNGPGGGQRMHFSVDGGESWSAAGALPQGNTCCDPTVDWSFDGSLAYAAALAECGAVCDITFYRSSDGGQTWNDLPGGGRRRLTTDQQNDKEFLHVDKFATSPFRDNLYLTWHKNNVMQFARSSDFGDTWQIQAFSSANDQLGIGSDITTDKGGAVYYIWPAFNSQRILLRKSTNGGTSFGPVIQVANTNASFDFPIPSMETRAAFIYVSADTDFSNGPFADSIYAAWLDTTGPESGTAANNHSRIQVAFSRDGGDTWSVTTPHETADANNVDRWNPWMAVGPDGKVHVIFYDTRRDASRSGVDVFYSFSDDGAQTWSTPIRVTSEFSPNIDDGFEFGDYNGGDIVLNDMIGIFTDNRNEGGGGADSVDVYAVGVPVSGDPTNTAPTVTITAPADPTTVVEGTSLTFTGTANDAEDGNLTGSIAWSSSLDGALGSGGSVSATLSVGTHTVTASVSDSGGLSASDTVTVTVTPDGGCTPGGLSTDFESGLAGWTTTGLWHRVTNSSCFPAGSSTPANTVYYGQDASCNYDAGDNNGTLTSPVITGILATSELSYDFFRQVESFAGGSFDQTVVEAKATTATTWTTVFSQDSGDASGTTWSTNSGISLGAFAGQDIQVRFRFDTVDGSFNAFTGWAVDDVVVTGETCDDPPPPGCTTLHDVGFESGAGGWSDAGNESSCTTGDFVVGNPTVTNNGGVTTQVGGSANGTGALFTQPNSTAGNADVDGGVCVTRSPVINAGGFANAEVSFNFFHGQRDAGDDAGDFFAVELSSDGGASFSSTLVSLGDVQNNAAWTPFSTTVNNPGQLQIRVRVADGAGPGDLVEAGIDDVFVCGNN